MRMALSCLLLLPLLVNTASGETLDLEPVSVTPEGLEPESHSMSPALSSDGKVVAFWSLAGDVDDLERSSCGDDRPEFTPYSCPEIFVADLEGSEIRRASLTWDGRASGQGARSYLDIDAAGKRVAFVSRADNLVRDDTNGISDVFVRDLVEGWIKRVSVASNGSEQKRAPGSFCQQSCGGPALSGDGRFVAFDSWSGNLVPDDDNDRADVFVHDLATGRTERMSVSTDGEEANDSAWKVTINKNGRFVAFQSTADNLVHGTHHECEIPPPFQEGKSCANVYLHDRHRNETVLVSTNATGARGDGASTLPSISDDGRFVAFSSDSTNLVPGLDLGFRRQVFVKDLETQGVFLVSGNNSGVPANDVSWSPHISGDGRYVVYASQATNLHPRFTSGTVSNYVYDRVTEQVKPVVLATDGGEPDDMVTQSRVSEDGSWIAFTSPASNIHEGWGGNHRNVYLAKQDSARLQDPGYEVAPAPYALFLLLLAGLFVSRRSTRVPGTCASRVAEAAPTERDRCGATPR